MLTSAVIPQIFDKLKKKTIKHAIKMLTSAVSQQFLTNWKRRESNTLTRCWPRLCFNNFWQIEKEENQTRYQDIDLGCDSTIFDKLKQKKIKHAIKMLTSAVIQQFLTSWKRRQSNTLSRCWPRLWFNNFWQAEKKENQTRYQDVNLGCDSTIFNKLKKKKIKHANKMLTSAVIQQFLISWKRRESNTISDIKIFTKFTSAASQQFLTSWKRRESNTLSRCWPRL